MIGLVRNNGRIVSLHPIHVCERSIQWFILRYHKNKKEICTTPLLLWLNGGPGASSLTGQFTEQGPYKMLNNNTIIRNQYTWTKYYHMLFIDQPAGTGYSYTDSNLHTYIFCI